MARPRPGSFVEPTVSQLPASLGSGPRRDNREQVYAEWILVVASCFVTDLSFSKLLTGLIMREENALSLPHAEDSSMVVAHELTSSYTSTSIVLPKRPDQLNSFSNILPLCVYLYGFRDVTLVSASRSKRLITGSVGYWDLDPARWIGPGTISFLRRYPES